MVLASTSCRYYLRRVARGTPHAYLWIAASLTIQAAPAGCESNHSFKLALVSNLSRVAIWHARRCRRRGNLPMIDTKWIFSVIGPVPPDGKPRTLSGTRHHRRSSAHQMPIRSPCHIPVAVPPHLNVLHDLTLFQSVARATTA